MSAYEEIQKALCPAEQQRLKRALDLTLDLLLTLQDKGQLTDEEDSTIDASGGRRVRDARDKTVPPEDQARPYTLPLPLVF